MKFIELYAISTNVKVLRYQDNKKNVQRLLLEKKKNFILCGEEHTSLSLMPKSIQNMVKKHWADAH